MSATTLDLIAERLNAQADNALRRRIDDTADPLRNLIHQLGASSATVSFNGAASTVSEVLVLVLEAIHFDAREQARREAVLKFIERAEATREGAMPVGR